MINSRLCVSQQIKVLTYILYYSQQWNFETTVWYHVGFSLFPTVWQRLLLWSLVFDPAQCQPLPQGTSRSSHHLRLNKVGKYVWFKYVYLFIYKSGHFVPESKFTTQLLFSIVVEKRAFHLFMCLNVDRRAQSQTKGLT